MYNTMFSPTNSAGLGLAGRNMSAVNNETIPEPQGIQSHMHVLCVYIYGFLIQIPTILHVVS